MAIKVFHRDEPDVYMPIISNDARLIVWPGVGAQVANMNFVVLEPGTPIRPPRTRSTSSKDAARSPISTTTPSSSSRQATRYTYRQACATRSGPTGTVAS